MTIGTGFIVSCLSSSSKARVNPELLSPFVRPKQTKEIVKNSMSEYQSVQQALQTIANGKPDKQDNYVL